MDNAMMDKSEVIEKLTLLLNNYGVSLSSDIAKIRGLLLDLCGNNKLEINLLVTAMKYGIPKDLLSAQVIDEIVMSRLVQKIHDNEGIAENFAEWAVMAWSKALGKDIVSLSVSGHKMQQKELHGQSSSSFVNVQQSGMAAQYSKQMPLSDLDGVVFDSRDNVLRNYEFILISGGSYLMGDGSYRDNPAHDVWVDDFYLGKYPVIFEVYDRYCEITGKEKPSDHGWGRGRLPVISVSWYDAKEFCEWLSEGTPQTYGLPTEAEWEYACRSGGKDEKWSGTSNGHLLREYAWCTENSGGRTHPVGEKMPNWLGLYDMSGNVWEWVEDVYAVDVYPKHSKRNPVYTNSGSFRVIRGGCWINGPQDVRCSDRFYDAPDVKGSGTGFRLKAKKK